MLPNTSATDRNNMTSRMTAGWIVTDRVATDRAECGMATTGVMATDEVASCGTAAGVVATVRVASCGTEADGVAIVRTVKPSTLSNRGYERSEHPRTAAASPDSRTPTGCPTTISDISLVVLYPKLLQQGLEFIAYCDTSMVLFMVDNVLTHLFLVRIGVGQGTVAALPASETGIPVRRGLHQVIGGNLEVMHKGCYRYRGMQRDEDVYVVRHAIGTIECAVALLAKTKDISIEIALVCFGNRSRALMSAEDYVVDEFCVCHSCGVDRYMRGDPVRVDDRNGCRHVRRSYRPTVTERRPRCGHARAHRSPYLINIQRYERKTNSQTKERIKN